MAEFYEQKWHVERDRFNEGPSAYVVDEDNQSVAWTSSKIAAERIVSGHNAALAQADALAEARGQVAALQEALIATCMRSPGWYTKAFEALGDRARELVWPAPNVDGDALSSAPPPRHGSEGEEE